MEKERRRSGDRARSECGFLTCGISLTEAVEEELEWIGVDDTEECRLPAVRIKLSISRPGMVKVKSERSNHIQNEERKGRPLLLLNRPNPWKTRKIRFFSNFSNCFHSGTQKMKNEKMKTWGISSS
jgi:hypothetical protein